MKKLTLLFTPVVLFAGAVCAQIPDTSAGRQFSAWLNAFNSGDRVLSGPAGAPCKSCTLNE
jgi:hypothetical protein